MKSPAVHDTPMPVRWWRALTAWVRRLVRRAPRKIGAGGTRASASREVRSVFGDAAGALSLELQEILRDLVDHRGAVVDTVASAIQDYGHLHRIVNGPGAGVDAVLDVTLLAEAEAVLTAIIVRAPEVTVLLQVAGQRPGDRAGREAAGDAMLVLRDQRRVLGALASAAIRWASSGAQADREHMHACAQRLAAAADTRQ